MARIVYKKGLEGQNRLECIEGIEIDMLNGQCALIYPKYAEKIMLEDDKIQYYYEEYIAEIAALKETESYRVTSKLFGCGSPAAKFISQFYSDNYGYFALPTLLAAMEIQDQKEDIDALAETIEGADLLRNYTACVWSCSRFSEDSGWIVCGGDFAINCDMCGWCLAVPVVLYR